MENKQKRHVGWIIVPPAIAGRTDLTDSEKLVLGKIIGLLSDKGYCFATNEYIASNTGKREDRVSKIISRLTEKKEIRIELLRKDGNPWKTERRIYIISKYAINTYVGVGVNGYLGVDANGKAGNGVNGNPIYEGRIRVDNRENKKNISNQDNKQEVSPSRKKPPIVIPIEHLAKTDPEKMWQLLNKVSAEQDERNARKGRNG